MKIVIKHRMISYNLHNIHIYRPCERLAVETAAVKAPWYGIQKNTLFALLGPNGAGKTTTINMLTGLTIPTGGDALMYDHSITTRSEMHHIKRMMGVCPQVRMLYRMLYMISYVHVRISTLQRRLTHFHLNTYVHTC